MKASFIDTWRFNSFRQKVKKAKVKGLIDRKEAYFLFSCATNGNLDKGHIVEIGSFFGYSTLFLAYGSRLRKRDRVVAIDPHIGNPEHQKDDPQFNSLAQFKKNIAMFDLQDQIDLKVMPSSQAARQWRGEPVRLLWIDGNHDYEYVKEDYELWEPYLVKGGILAFHDATSISTWPGPKKLVEELAKSDKFEPFQYLHGIAWTRKLK